jgi:hypothetical protein
MNFTANSHLEIFVRNFAITIQIKLIKELFELLIGDTSEAPVFKVEPELFWLYGS